jgi:hypothetical protein
MRDVTVMLKYEIPAIRNSDHLTGNHTCILNYLYFLSLKAISIYPQMIIFQS